MAHTPQERYSKLVSAKLRNELVLKDGFVFNNDYEGSPSAGAVKIPVRDTEVQVSDYDKANGITATNGDTSYTTLNIDKDKAVNEIIESYSQEQTTENEKVTVVGTTIEENTEMEAEVETTVETNENQVEENVESSFSGTYHTVKKGQTLYDISMKYYGTSEMVNKIKEINHIDENFTIIEGEKILLP